MESSIKTGYGKLAAAAIAVAMIGGCAAVDQSMGNMSQGGRTAAGAGAGAAVGAGLGVLVGDSSKAALIGAGIGAVAGSVMGYNWSGIKNDVEQSGAQDLGVNVVEMPDGTLKVHIPGNVSFDTGKSDLKAGLLPVLDSVARALAQHPELRAKAIGYTDSTGPAQLNQRLSLSRAESVTNYISRQGISMGRLAAQGRASANPIGDNSTEQGRALNRRIELFLYAVKQ